MPVTVIILSSTVAAGVEPPSLTFDGPRVVLGRGAGCDVRLPDPSVSHRHASLRLSGSELHVVDEGSSNGTFVDDKRIAANTSERLESGSVVRLGRVWIEVRIDATPPTRDLAFATRDLALALVSQAMRAMGDDVHPRVRVVDGPDANAEIVLADEGRAYTVGRGEEADLPLADEDVSRAHVQIVRRGSGVLVHDLGSKNGVLLGEAKIPAERGAPWRAGAYVRLGRTTLALEEPVASALAELEESADDAMAPDEVVERPSRSAERAASPHDTGSATRTANVTGGAPIASVSAAPAARPRNVRKPAWSPTDLAVVLAALAVMALSIAGLYWLLRS